MDRVGPSWSGQLSKAETAHPCATQHVGLRQGERPDAPWIFLNGLSVAGLPSLKLCQLCHAPALPFFLTDAERNSQFGERSPAVGAGAQGPCSFLTRRHASRG